VSDQHDEMKEHSGGILGRHATFTGTYGLPLPAGPGSRANPRVKPSDVAKLEAANRAKRKKKIKDRIEAASTEKSAADIDALADDLVEMFAEDVEDVADLQDAVLGFQSVAEGLIAGLKGERDEVTDVARKATSAGVKYLEHVEAKQAALIETMVVEGDAFQFRFEIGGKKFISVVREEKAVPVIKGIAPSLSRAQIEKAIDEVVDPILEELKTSRSLGSIEEVEYVLEKQAANARRRTTSRN
jgi:hypothetical protein